VVALLVLVLAGCSKGPDEPHFFRAEGGRRLHLPSRMRLALHEFDREFRVLERKDFAREIVEPQPGWRYPFDEHQEPWAVLADFDGDGDRDAALLGSSGKTLKLLVVWADSSEPQAASLRERAWDSRVERRHLDEFLQHRPAGPVPWAGGDEDTTFTIPHDGVELVYFEKAAVTRYYDGDVWREIVTGD
jgi:hypothetical protein